MQEHWNRIYSDKLAEEVTWYQERPETSLKLISHLKLGPNASIIDVGAGASRLVDNLIQRGFSDLTAIDLSKKALEQAQSRLADQASQVNWFVGDICRARFTKRFDLWHDRAVFHFLTNVEDRQDYLNILKSSLKNNGFFIISTFAEDGPLKCSGQNIVRYSNEKMLQEVGEGFTLLDFKKETHVSPKGMEQKFNYWVFQKSTS